MSTKEERPILLVEDDPLLRDALRILLEEAGYLVRVAATAAETLAAVAVETPALILLDLGLPDRSGLDVVRMLRARPGTRPTPIVALTGSVGPRDRQACLEAGCTSFLAKPVEPQYLLRRLPTLLQSG
jgi:CheY-like chemotaxis protein